MQPEISGLTFIPSKNPFPGKRRSVLSSTIVMIGATIAFVIFL